MGKTAAEDESPDSRLLTPCPLPSLPVLSPPSGACLLLPCLFLLPHSLPHPPFAPLLHPAPPPLAPLCSWPPLPVLLLLQLCFGSRAASSTGSLQPTHSPAHSGRSRAGGTREGGAVGGGDGWCSFSYASPKPHTWLSSSPPLWSPQHSPVYKLPSPPPPSQSWAATCPQLVLKSKIRLFLPHDDWGKKPRLDLIWYYYRALLKKSFSSDKIFVLPIIMPFTENSVPGTSMEN